MALHSYGTNAVDWDQRADMERGRGAIEADIGRHDPLEQGLVEALEVATILHEAALDHQAQELGFRLVGHRSSL